MAGFIVALNGDTLVSVSADDLDLLTVLVHGDILGQALGSVDIYGGRYGQGDNNEHLIWINDREISADDVIDIAFADDVAPSQAGKTIEELFPEPGIKREPDRSMEEWVEELSSRPKARKHFVFELGPPDADPVNVTTAADDYSYNLRVVWMSNRPDHARVSLTSNSLEKIANRQDGSKHAGFTLTDGQSLRVRVRQR